MGSGIFGRRFKGGNCGQSRVASVVIMMACQHQVGTGLGGDVDVGSLQRRILEWTKWHHLPSLGILFMEGEKAETLISIKPR